MDYRPDKKHKINPNLCQKALKRFNYAYTANLVRESKFAHRKLNCEDKIQLGTTKESIGAPASGLIQHLNRKLSDLTGTQIERKQHRFNQMVHHQSKPVELMSRTRQEWYKLQTEREVLIDADSVPVNMLVLITSAEIKSTLDEDTPSLKKMLKSMKEVEPKQQKVESVTESAVSMR